MLVSGLHHSKSVSNNRANRPTYPAYTNISGNLAFEMGYYGKQTAAYFKSIAYKTNLENNVFFNSPVRECCIHRLGLSKH